jgi:hypothetical protein
MEPSWTEPTPVTWVLILAHECPICRRRGDRMIESEPEPC